MAAYCERWQKVRKVQFPPGDLASGTTWMTFGAVFAAQKKSKTEMVWKHHREIMILDLLCFDKHILLGVLYYLHWLLRKMAAFSDDHRSQSLKLFRPRTSSGKKSCGSTCSLCTA
jgi:hypothetical protein